jgi:3-hydroxybutyryl-CoA dehydrogenase
LRVEEIRRVVIVGAGTMGQQIAFQCAGHGFEVVLHDVAPGALSSATEAISAYADWLVQAGAIGGEVKEQALARITTEGDQARAATEADILCEAIPEDPKLKGRVLAEFNAVCPDRTIFATNTSTLLPSQFADASGRPDRLLALHFHLPVWSNNVVDVMPHRGTSPEVSWVVAEFARRIGQVPIALHREHHGYVFNAMYTAINREAITMAERRVASIEDIDRAWMGIMKSPIGPFGMLDAVGIDTAWKITNYWAGKLFWQRQIRRNARFLKAYVDRGHLGLKSGQGFYTYPDPAFGRPGFIEGS